MEGNLGKKLNIKNGKLTVFVVGFSLVLLMAAGTFFYTRLTPKKSVSSSELITQSSSLLYQKDYKQIISKLENQSFSNDDERKSAETLLAQSYFATKQFDQAIDHYNQAIGLSDSAAEQSSLQNYLANCYRNKGNFEEAESHYRAAVNGYNNQQAWINLAYLYQQRNRNQEAINILKEAQSRMPNDSEISKLLNKFQS